MSKVAGVDVSAEFLECKVSEVPDGFKYKNDGKGRLRLLKKLQGLGVNLVILEATGGYEKAFCRLLWASDVPVSVVNPRWIRRFAQSQGRYAKNDRIDADVLVLFGERMDVKLTPPVPEEIEELRILLTRRHQLVDMVVMEKNHEKAPETCATVRKSIRQLRKMLQAQVAEMDKQILKLISNSPAMKPRAERLKEETGVGPVLMATLIADVPELGTVRRNAASALLGVAPYNDDSGKHSGKRAIAGGRARPRRALYMATLAAIRHDEHLKAFYKRLISRGKPRKVAIVACMRKFTIRLNTVLKKLPEQNFMAAA